MQKKDVEDGVTAERLKKYEDDRLYLVSMGLDIGDLTMARNVFQNLKKMKFDPKLSLSILKGFQDLVSKVALLEAEEAEESAKMEALHKGVKAVEDEIHQKEALVEQARSLQSSGLSIEMVEDVKKLAVDMGAKRGMRPDEALAKFSKEVLKEYDSVLGLQPKVASLKQELDKSRAELKDEQEKLDVASKALGSFGEVVKSYSALQEKGVKDEVVTSLNTVISQTGLTPKEIELDLLKNRSLAQYNGALEKQIEENKRLIEALHTDFEAAQKEADRQLTMKREDIKKAEEDAKEAMRRVAEAGGVSADFESVKAVLEQMKGDSTSLELIMGEKNMEMDAVIGRVAEANNVEADLEAIRRERDRQKAEVEFFTRDDERFEGEWREKLRKYQAQVTSAQVEKQKVEGSFEALKEVVEKEMRSTKYLLCFDRLTDEKSLGQLAPDAAVIAMQTAVEGFGKFLALHKDDVWTSEALVSASGKLGEELASAYPKVAP